MIIKTKLTPVSLLAIALTFFSIVGILFFSTPNIQPANSPSAGMVNTSSFCGYGPTAKSKTANSVQTSIDFGCKGSKCLDGTLSNCAYISPITDLLFAVIRFLSLGVGLVVVASMVYAGIQYVTSRGEPQATQHAMNRIRSNIIALVIYIFAFAILSYVIPPGYLL